jgi:hypothetical protein
MISVKFRLNIFELLLAVAIIVVIAAFFIPVLSHRPRPVKEQEMFGYWIAIPGPHEAFRLFLTNGGAGWLGSWEIYSNLDKVMSWKVTNRDITIDLQSVTEPTWPHEYIRGKVGFSQIVGERGGLNQNGEHWTRDITFYREQEVMHSLAVAASVMTNELKSVESDHETNGNVHHSAVPSGLGSTNAQTQR